MEMVCLHLCERATATNGRDDDDSTRLHSFGVCVRTESSTREKQFAYDNVLVCNCSELGIGPDGGVFYVVSEDTRGEQREELT